MLLECKECGFLEEELNEEGLCPLCETNKRKYALVCCDCAKELKSEERYSYGDETYCLECLLEQLDRDGIIEY